MEKLKWFAGFIGVTAIVVGGLGFLCVAASLSQPSYVSGAEVVSKIKQSCKEQFPYDHTQEMICENVIIAKRIDQKQADAFAAADRESR
jgi:hypothetical protein